MDEDLIQARLREWDAAAWSLAALVLAGREDGPADLVAASRAVLAAAGIDDLAATTPSPELALGLANQAAAPLHITSALLTGAAIAWSTNDDAGLRAQGRASAQAAPLFAAHLVSGMGDLAARLATPAARMLDVGTGVAALAVGFAEVFPQLYVLGIDVMDRALTLAAETIAASAVADRVSVRKQDVASLAEHDVFDLAWLPAPFIPSAALNSGIARVVAATRPGGWLIVGHGRFGEGPAADALTRLKTLAFGGTPLDSAAAQDLLRRHGLIDVRTAPTPPGAPGVTIGQRPSD